MACTKMFIGTILDQKSLLGNCSQTNVPMGESLDSAYRFCIASCQEQFELNISFTSPFLGIHYTD